MKKAIIATSLAAVLCSSAQADTLLGLYIGGHVWDTEATGSLGEKNSQTQDIALQEFNFEDQQHGSFYVALEHPIPLIPNIKIASTTLDTDGQTVITESDFSFGDIPYPIDTTVNTEFNVSYVDYTFYYEILDNDLLTLDIGLTAREFEGDMTITDDIGVLSLSVEEFSAVVPMLYGSVIIGLPLTGLNIFFQGNYTGYDDSKIQDFQAGISYSLLDNLAVDLNIELGYKVFKMDIEDIDDIYADLEFKGIFAGATIHF
jgi:outer membrane protein